MLLKAAILYLVISLSSMPFLKRWWIGKIPVVALIQLPKTQLATWLMNHAIIPIIRMLGFSPGSPSPEYIMARPYALVAAYLIPLCLLLLILWIRTRLSKPLWIWACVLVILACIDFYCTWIYSRGPGLTIY